MASSKLRIRTLLTGPQDGLNNLLVLPDSDGLLQDSDQSVNSSSPYPEHLSIDIPKGCQQAYQEINDQTLLWTIEETARQLSVHPRTVNRLIEKGELPVVRIGRAKRIEMQAVHHFISNRREYNGQCVESAVWNPTGERACRIGTRRDVKMAVSTQVRTTRSASPQMEKDFNVLLGLEP